MNFVDEAVVFPCAGESLVGVVSKPEMPGEAGLLVIVGGPQYRAGSHRQFVALARRAAAAGVTALRFDYRGMGDSSGAPVGFEGADDDVRAAIDALMRHSPSVRRIHLWGLCDGASAALMYLQRTGDPRVAGVCILNPWVRSAATLARTQVKHYYGQRLLQREFWSKLLRGGINITGALGELAGKLRTSVGGRAAPAADMSFQTRMANGLREFSGTVLLVISGRDMTAKEFEEYAASDPDWSVLVDPTRLARYDVPDADHTFSSAVWRARVEEATLSRIVAGAAR